MDNKTITRFWLKVDKNGPVPPHLPELGACWLWTACENGQGYGAFGIGRTVHVASRVSWAITHGGFPGDKIAVCHKCDVRRCVRPDHLFLGTRAENLADMRAKGRGVAPPHLIGVAHNMTPFTESDVLEIRALVASGTKNQSQIARERGVSSNAINAIVRRRSWKHI